MDDRSGDEFEAWPGDGAGDGDPAHGSSGSGSGVGDTAGSATGEGQWGRGRRRTGPVTGVLAPLVAVLAGLAGPEGLDDQTLAEAVVDLQRVRSLLDATAAAYVGRWDGRRVWADDGSRSAGARLARDAGTRMAADDERLDPNDPVDVARHEQAERAKRRCRMAPVGDGWQLSAHFDRVSGAIVHTALERICQELFEAEWAQAAAALDDPSMPAPILRTASQRRLDALVELARRAGATSADDQAPKPLISVVVSAGELFGPIRETSNGLVLSRLEVARLLTEAEVESIVFDDTTTQPVTVSSRARFFTGALRRAVEVRDRVCQHPTCRVEAEYCQIDHVVEATAGGQTSVTNGRLLCGVHNRQRPGRRTQHRHGDITRSDSDGDPDQPQAA